MDTISCEEHETHLQKVKLFLSNEQIIPFTKYLIKNKDNGGNERALFVFIITRMHSHSDIYTTVLRYLDEFYPNSFSSTMYVVLNNYKPFVETKTNTHCWKCIKETPFNIVQISYDERILNEWITLKNVKTLFYYIVENKFAKRNELEKLFEQYCSWFRHKPSNTINTSQQLPKWFSLIGELKPIELFHAFLHEPFEYVCGISTYPVFHTKYWGESIDKKYVHECLCETEFYCEYILHMKRNCLVTIMDDTFQHYDSNNIIDTLFSNEYIVKSICGFF